MIAQPGASAQEQFGLYRSTNSTSLSNLIDADFPSSDAGLSSTSMVADEVARPYLNKQLIDTLRRSKLFRGYEKVLSEAQDSLLPCSRWTTGS